MDWTTIWMALGACASGATLLVAVVALPLGLRQLKAIREQSGISAKATTSQLYGLVSGLMNRMNRVFERHPHWIEYFYYDQEPPELGTGPSRDRTLRLNLDNVCEGIMDFVDGVVEQRRAMPGESMDWSTWHSYFRDLHKHSPVLQAYVANNLDYYPDYVVAAVGYIVVRDEDSGYIEDEWIAVQMDPDDGDDATCVAEFFDSPIPEYARRGGYPWIQTWIVRPRKEHVGGAGVLATVEAIGGERSRVHVRVRGQVTVLVRRAIRDWIMNTISDSKRLKAVEFLVEPDEHSQELSGVYDLVAPGCRAESTFLMPTYLKENGSRRGFRRPPWR